MIDALEPSKILYQDAQCVVVNKNYGEAMEGVGEGLVNLPELLAKTFGGVKTAAGTPFYPTAVHRLDVPVSGCALFGRTPAALADLNSCFADGRARKTYWAVCELPRDGSEAAQAAELIHFIQVDGKHNKSYAHTEDGKERKRAILRYRVIGRGDRYLFLEIELITGRHHQIRAQLAAAGLFIKGDLKYGARRSETGGGIRLHARTLAFPNPIKPEMYIQATAAPPIRDPLWEAFEAASKA
jgi:23S rRNA pseudouridine1911/1915/1917 synthase